MTDGDTAYLSTKDLAGVSAYHTDPDCQNLPAETREWPIEKAERRGLAECRYCDPDHTVAADDWSPSLRHRLEQADDPPEVVGE